MNHNEQPLSCGLHFTYRIQTDPDVCRSEELHAVKYATSGIFVQNEIKMMTVRWHPCAFYSCASPTFGGHYEFDFAPKGNSYSEIWKQEQQILRFQELTNW